MVNGYSVSARRGLGTEGEEPSKSSVSSSLIICQVPVTRSSGTSGLTLKVNGTVECRKATPFKLLLLGQGRESGSC